MPSFFIKTYGCQMNERDSEQVARDLVDRGFIPATHEKEADIILLNTCSVREMAESKAIGKMGFLKKLRRDKPQLVLGYLGCMAQRLGGALVEKTPHVDLVVGTQKFHRVADYVEEALKRRSQEEQEEFRELAAVFRTPIVDIEAEMDSQNTIRDHLFLEPATIDFKEKNPQQRSVHQVLEGASTGATPFVAAEELQYTNLTSVISGNTTTNPLFKLAEADEKQGADSAQQRSVHQVLEGASTGATPFVAASVEFKERVPATAFISVMQGCNMHCTFCIVPTTRGPERGRPIADI
ncbi:MAG: hypothetical protein DVB29_07180, partial [Verrucomicrobia bacterium]